MSFVEEAIPVKIKILDDRVNKEESLPSYMTSHSSGMDLRAMIDREIAISPGSIELIPTGIAVAVPPGYELQIRPRSGLALNYGVTLPNTPGTVDADYRGEIKVILMNLGKETFVVRPGDRIAQMVLTPVYKVKWEIVEELPASDRGDGGFGHTGI